MSNFEILSHKIHEIEKKKKRKKDKEKDTGSKEKKKRIDKNIDRWLTCVDEAILQYAKLDLLKKSYSCKHGYCYNVYMNVETFAINVHEKFCVDDARAIAEGLREKYPNFIVETPENGFYVNIFWKDLEK